MSRYQVVILTHLSTTLPFEQAIVDLLTQFFWTINTTLHTSIHVEGLKTELSHKRTRGKQFQKEPRCHGVHNPVSLCFRCNGRDNGIPGTFVFAKKNDVRPNEPTLHIVIKNCKLTILLTCSVNSFLSDYLSTLDPNQPRPDLLMCQGELINVWTVEIYMVLLMNILDSYFVVHDQDTIYYNIRESIIKIFQFVNLFEDASKVPSTSSETVQQTFPLSLGCRNVFEEYRVAKTVGTPHNLSHPLQIYTVCTVTSTRRSLFIIMNR
jgi:hypothetical protein